MRELKIWWEKFRRLREAASRDEVYCDFRRNDREFQLGDLVVYREWAPLPPYAIQAKYPHEAVTLSNGPPHHFYTGDEMREWSVVPPSIDQAHYDTGYSVRAVIAYVRTTHDSERQGLAEDCLPHDGEPAPLHSYVSLSVRVLQNSTSWISNAWSSLREGRVPPRFVCSACRTFWADQYVRAPYVEEFTEKDGVSGLPSEIGWLTAEDLGQGNNPEERAAEHARLDAEAHESRFNTARLADRSLDTCPTCGYLMRR